MPDKQSMEAFYQSSLFSGGNADYIEQLFEDYLFNPQSVPPVWRETFDALPGVKIKDVSHHEILAQLKAYDYTANGRHASGEQTAPELLLKVWQWIQAYRLHGHAAANLDPLALSEKKAVPELSRAYHGLDDINLEETVSLPGFLEGKPVTIAHIEAHLQECYCQSLAIEHMHMVDAKERFWIQSYVEGQEKKPLDDATKQLILDRLTAAEGLEKYLGSKYPGAKRFSLEGGDALIVMLDAIIHQVASHGTKEVVIGMAHRGRLNVLVNCLGKLPSDLFDEFEGNHGTLNYSGDVKYHQGFSSDIDTPAGAVHVALAFNPSHLEIVTPVVLGSVAARQHHEKDSTHDKVLPVAIHGDAAFSGQGVVMEVLNMSQTRGYGVGGCLHIVVNNQVGFTTSKIEDARSTLYCSDVAKMIQSPVLHVNADDPEAVLEAVQLALHFRETFKKDVVIDLVCYRRHGHNEADEPALTQPVMVSKIKSHRTVREQYAEKLVNQGVLPNEGPDELMTTVRDRLTAGQCVARHIFDKTMPPRFDWGPYVGTDEQTPYEIETDETRLSQLGQAMVALPEDFQAHSRLKKLYDDRAQMATNSKPMDWGFAETLAYALILSDGGDIRLSGQDCGRGTFSHRQVVAHHQKTGETHVPLQHLSEKQGEFKVIDSLLSEEAVLAYEYGYASTDPDGLVIWEAQFGDFANGAQVVIDQFISSGEQKWGRLCGLIMLLPHGYEGMGPEHSSARLERYLQLCAQQNIQVCVPSTPAQIFHCLYRQYKRPVRKPLVILSPKSLLRRREVVCDLSDLTQQPFQSVMGDDLVKPDAATRVILCSGKVYYDLCQYRHEHQLDKQVAIVRIEQLYPFPEAALKTILSSYSKTKTIIWCQEEPLNQGAWYSTSHHLMTCLSAKQALTCVARPASASPAAGYAKVHQQEQAQLLEEAFTQ